MELQGTVVQICEPQKFTGRNGEFTKFGFVIETAGQFPKKVHFQVFGDERWQKMGIQQGEDVLVGFDVSSREWNGKWFTSCEAWRVLRDAQQPQTTATQPQAQQPRQQVAQPTSTNDDQLPF